MRRTVLMTITLLAIAAACSPAGDDGASTHQVSHYAQTRHEKDKSRSNPDGSPDHSSCRADEPNS